MHHCPNCGKPMLTIEGTERCLACGFPRTKTIEVEDPFQTKDLERVTTEAQRLLLDNVGGSLDYLKARGISRSTIDAFHLGYVPGGTRLFRTQWENMNLQDRILFPILSADGTRTIAFGARKLPRPNDDRPKYLNSASGAGYVKGAHLYGEWNLPQEKAPYIYLCEGYVDVLSMYAKGFMYPVASLGTALTNEQAWNLHNRAEKVVISYDSDEPGQIAVERAINALRYAGFNIKEIDVLQITGAKDVDEALQKQASIKETTALRWLAASGRIEAFAEGLVESCGA